MWGCRGSRSGPRRGLGGYEIGGSGGGDLDACNLFGCGV